MYAVSKEGVFAGYADSVVSIRLHENGSYVPCADDEADGFCAKMARELTTEDDESITGMVDTVYCFNGKVMHGDEPIGSFEQINGAAQLMNSENTVTALVGQSITPQRAARLRPMIEAAATSLPDSDAATAVELFPKWVYPVSYIEGNRVSDGGKLYKCQQAHTSQGGWKPSTTPALWVVIDVAHAGTQDDPIPASRGMEYEYGKYYLDSEDGKTYKCERIGEAAGGKIVLQYLPHELVGQYFTAV
jgi:hypothetical protein|nr:MAG TPA: ChiA1-BD-binding domain protein [Caudoviricetes sp.]